MSVWLPAVLTAGSLFLAGEARTAARRSTIVALAGLAQIPRHHGDKPSKVILERLGRVPVIARLGSGDRLFRRVQLAGLGWARERVAAVRFLALLVTAVSTLLMLPGKPIALPVAAIAVLAALRLPELVVARLAARRQSRIDRQVADLVELLLVTTEAGLSPPLAFRRSAEVLGATLGEELRAAVQAMDLGVTWRGALDHLAARTESPGLRALSTALMRSQRLGVATSPALKGLADDLRTARRARTEELARRAPVKMLFPLVFLVLPAFLLLTVGPVLLATIRSLH